MVWKGSMWESCERKCLFEARGQRRMGRLIQADRRATLTEITTRYNWGKQQSICEATTRTTTFLLRHSDGRDKIWRKQNENMNHSCLVTTGWWWWCNGVGDLFLAHFRPLSANWASFKCHGLPEHCYWPCPSLNVHHVPILWWLLPAG